MAWAITPATLTPAAARLYEQFEHLDIEGEAEGWPWAVFCQALTAPYDDLYDLLAGAEVPWAPAFDPVLAGEVLRPEFARAVLQWSAQFVGLSPALAPLPGEALDPSQSPLAMVGGVDAIKLAVRRQLIAPPDGAPFVLVLERIGGDPYHFAVTVRRDQTPDAVALTWETANRLANPSLETDAAGYTVSSGDTLTRTNLSAYAGSYSGRVTLSGIEAVLDTPALTLDGATEVSARWRVWNEDAPSGSEGARVQLVFKDGASATVGTVNGTLLSDPPSDATAITATAPVPGGAVTVTPRLLFTGVDTDRLWFDAGEVYFDAPLPSEYADGDSADHRWAGTAHASNTERVASWTSAAVRRAVEAVTPAGRRGADTDYRFDLFVIDGGTYEDLLATHATYQEVLDAFATYQDLLDDPSGP